MNTDLSFLQTFIATIKSYSPEIQLTIDIITIIVGLSMIFALAGLPFIAVVSEVLAIIKQRSFYNKCARQIAGVTIILSIVVILAGAYITKIRIDSMQELTLIAQGYVIWWIFLTLAGFLISLYFVLWKSMQQLPRLHQCIALSSGFCSIISAYCILSLLSAESEASAIIDFKINNIAEIFTPSQSSNLWNILFMIPGVIISLAASFAIMWLLIRRNKDDYGRDYYNTMLTWLAKWARNGWILLWGTSLIFLVYNSWYAYMNLDVAMSMQEYINSAIYLLLWSIPILLYILAIKSKTPLRNKISLIIAHFIIMSFTAQLFVNITNI